MSSDLEKIVEIVNKYKIKFKTGTLPYGEHSRIDVFTYVYKDREYSFSQKFFSKKLIAANEGKILGDWNLFINKVENKSNIPPGYFGGYMTSEDSWDAYTAQMRHSKVPERVIAILKILINIPLNSREVVFSGMKPKTVKHFGEIISNLG